MKKVLINIGLFAFAAALASCNCNSNSVLGEWIEPIPGMDGVQGVKLEKDGKASSINMATLVYESWQQQGDTLILTANSIGNKIAFTFQDTLIVTKVDGGRILKSKDGSRTYTKK